MVSRAFAFIASDKGICGRYGWYFVNSPLGFPPLRIIIKTLEIKQLYLEYYRLCVLVVIYAHLRNYRGLFVLLALFIIFALETRQVHIRALEEARAGKSSAKNASNTNKPYDTCYTCARDLVIPRDIVYTKIPEYI